MILDAIKFGLGAIGGFWDGLRIGHPGLQRTSDAGLPAGIGGILFLMAATSLGAPVVVTHGGAVHGSYSSEDPKVAAVTIQTTEPVTLDGCILTGRGVLIAGDVAHVDLTVRNCTGTGENPNVAGECAGRFINLESFDRLIVEHCELDQTAGIYLRDYQGHGEGPTVRVVANRAKNIDGRKSDGHGGYLPFNLREDLHTHKVESGFVERQFLQLDRVHAPRMVVSGNYITNLPGLSRVEDNINLYNSGGTVGSPLVISNNCIRGAYSISPGLPTRDDGKIKFDWSYTGGGIMLGDGADRTVASAASYIAATDNVVIGTSNYGMAVAAGHDISFSRNVIVSSGTLADGRMIFSENVGAYVWDAYHGKRVVPSVFFDDGGSDNSIRWMKGNVRNDAWVPDAAFWTGNTVAVGAVTAVVTVADENRAAQLWVERTMRSGLRVGVQVRP